MRKAKLALVAALAGTLGFCSASAPAFADPPKAPAPPPKVPYRTDWIKPGEVVVKVPNPFDPNSKYRRANPDDPDYLKDPYVWA